MSGEGHLYGPRWPRDDTKRCFTYCGPELCDCSAREAFSTLDFIAPALPVLSTMCSKAGLPLGAKKADEMRAAVESALLQPIADQPAGAGNMITDDDMGGAIDG